MFPFNLEHFQVTNGSCSSVGHRVKTHRIIPATVNERGDIEIKDYVILSHVEDDRIPPHTLVMDVTMTHDRYGRTTE